MPIILKNDLQHILSVQKEEKERCYQEWILEGGLHADLLII